MKPLQLMVVVATGVACLAVLAWLGRTAPPVILPTTITQKPTPPAEKPAETPPPAEKEHYAENPFPKDEAGPHPKAEIPETQYDFGRMALGKTGEHDFVVRNVGSVPLKLAKGPTQCKCTVSGLKEQEVAPGGEAQVHLAWTPKENGQFSQVATIWTNDPEHRQILLGANGLMFPEIVVSPDKGWSLGPIPAGQQTTFAGQIHSNIIENLEITKVIPSSEQVKLDVVPWTEAELMQHDAKWGYALNGVLLAGQEPGPIQELITLETNNAEHPKFEFSVTGTRTGALTIIGPGWHAGQHLVNFEKVSSEAGKQLKLTVILASFGKPLELLDVQSDPAFLTVSLKPEQVGGDAKRERYSLIIAVPKGSPKGVWHSARLGSIKIKTNHPQIPELELKVVMDIQ